MTVSRRVTIEEFNQMMSYKVYAENKEQKRATKLQPLKGVKEAASSRGTADPVALRYCRISVPETNLSQGQLV